VSVARKPPPASLEVLFGDPIDDVVAPRPTLAYVRSADPKGLILAWQTPDFSLRVVRSS